MPKWFQSLAQATGTIILEPSLERRTDATLTQLLPPAQDQVATALAELQAQQRSELQTVKTVVVGKNTIPFLIAHAFFLRSLSNLFSISL